MASEASRYSIVLGRALEICCGFGGRLGALVRDILTTKLAWKLDASQGTKAKGLVKMLCGQCHSEDSGSLVGTSM